LDADKSENDPNEPLALLDFSPTRELHWGTFPDNMEGLSSAWCAPLKSERWYHVAVVNDRDNEGKYEDVRERPPVSEGSGLRQSEGYSDNREGMDGRIFVVRRTEEGVRWVHRGGKDRRERTEPG